MEKDSIIVLSGGMDSVTLLHDYQQQIALAITFDYGSNHNAREIECAKWHCQELGIEHIVVRLTLLRELLSSSLFEGAEQIPEGSYGEENMKSTVVPFRNGIMLSMACGVAESRGLKQVLIANHSGDHAIYPDCTSDFIKAMDGAMQAGTYDHVSLLAPYTQLSKGEIAKIGKRLNLDYSTTYSCYKGGEIQCGVCATCVERKEAMREAGIEDTTKYEQ
ncbi:MAG: 7-cyano-7-deazaguanine synthase QueC [Porphyromonas sp.]|nr:7-cyano-7-deazaguanine synthase QueC [Porphyromonas sp.]